MNHTMPNVIHLSLDPIFATRLILKPSFKIMLIFEEYSGNPNNTQNIQKFTPSIQPHYKNHINIQTSDETADKP